MVNSKWITCVLFLTAAISYVKADETENKIKGLSAYGHIDKVPKEIRRPHLAKGKYARRVEEDICDPACVFFYPAERPHCVILPLPEREKTKDEKDDDCLCGLGHRIFQKDCTCVTPPKVIMT